ncbi:MAG TPA: response regulator transcription factor [Candidatus Limnocylindrales bacterium]|nr:response regulator transcription factor [Candidatus Limnocylindrales bacterium]
MRILVSESDSDFAAFLEQSFRADSHTVDLAQTPDQARLLVDKNPYDLTLLDVSVSDDSGVELLKYLRRVRPHMPVLVLINQAQLDDSTRLLGMGADDFVFRPGASSPELSARVRSALLHSTRLAEPILRVDDLELDPAKRTVSRGGRPIHLTLKEFSLLEYLMRNVGHGVTREQIVENAWSLPVAPQTNVVEVYINSLRKKIDGHSQRKLIHTIRGSGYELGDAPAFQHRKFDSATA